MHLKNVIPAEQKRAIDDVVRKVLCGQRAPQRLYALQPGGGPGTFPDGKHYKIEMVGPSNHVTLMRLLDMVESAKMRTHRVVGTLGGLGSLSECEIARIAVTEQDRRFEFITTPISPLTGVEGKHPSEGSLFGLRLRGAKSIKEYLYQMMRGINGGLRTFLVWDDVILECVYRLQQRNIMPLDIAFKVSIFAGVTNAFGLNRWVDDFPFVTSINPVALKLKDLAELRRMGHGLVSFDVHNNTMLSMDGLDRTREIHKIIRVAAPVIVKIERGERVATLMNERSLVQDVFPLVIESTRKFLEHMKKYPELEMVER